MTIRVLSLPVAALLASLALSACAGSAESDAGETPSASSAPSQKTAPGDAPKESGNTVPGEAEPDGAILAVTIAGSDVGPNAAQLTVAPGEPLTITFDTDRAGELHVHSKPEQYVEFEAGRSTQELVINAPGTVEIEEHDSETIVALLQVH